MKTIIIICLVFNFVIDPVFSKQEQNKLDFKRAIASDEDEKSTCELAYEKAASYEIEKITKGKYDKIGINIYTAIPGLIGGSALLLVNPILGFIMIPVIGGATGLAGGFASSIGWKKKLDYYEFLADMQIAEGNGNKFINKILKKAERHNITRDQVIIFIQKSIRTGDLCDANGAPLQLRHFRRVILNAIDNEIVDNDQEPLI